MWTTTSFAFFGERNINPKKCMNYRNMTDSEGHEFHYTQLPKHCRVCGKHCSSRESKYSVREHTSDLLPVYGVLAEKYDPAIHPPEFCHACYCKMKRETPRGTPTMSRAHIWNKHTPENCLVRKYNHVYTVCMYTKHCSKIDMQPLPWVTTGRQTEKEEQ